MNLKFTSKLLLILLIGIGTAHVHCQNLSLNIQKWDGSEKSVELNQLRKITFSGTNLTINYQLGTSESLETSLVRKMVFGPFTAVNNLFEDAGTVLIYPNPSADFIYFKNLPEGTNNIIVCSINGVQIMNVTSDTKRIDLSRLTKGVYLVKINNQVLKFTKL